MRISLSHKLRGEWAFFVVVIFVGVVLVFSYLLSLKLPEEPREKDKLNKQTTELYNLNFRPSSYQTEDNDQLSFERWTEINCFRTVGSKSKASKTDSNSSLKNQKTSEIGDNDKTKEEGDEGTKKLDFNYDHIDESIEFPCHKSRCVFENIDVYTDTFINVVLHIPPVDSVPVMPRNFQGHLPCLKKFFGKRKKLVRFHLSDEPYNPARQFCSETFGKDIPVYIISPMFSNNMFHTIFDILFPLVHTIHQDYNNLIPQNQILANYANLALEDGSENPTKKLIQLFSKSPVKSLRDWNSPSNRLCIRSLRLGLESASGICLHSSNPPWSFCRQVARSIVRHVKGVFQLQDLPYDKLNITYMKKKNSRRIVNEDQMIQTLDRLAKTAGGSVQVVYMSEMNLSEQVRTMHKTTVLVGLHGDDLTHSMWMREDTAAIVVYPHGCHNYIYNHVMQMRNVTGFVYQCQAQDTQFISASNRRLAMENGWPDVKALRDNLGLCPSAVRDNDVHINIDNMERAVKQAFEEVMARAEMNGKL